MEELGEREAPAEGHGAEDGPGDPRPCGQHRGEPPGRRQASQGPAEACRLRRWRPSVRGG